MEEKYWKQFCRTGKVADYLYYKGIELCSHIMDKYEGEQVHESDYIDGHGACGDACRRI